MSTLSDKKPKQQIESVSNRLFQNKMDLKNNPEIADNRTDTIAKNKLQEYANSSSKVKQLCGFQDIANKNNRQAILSKEKAKNAKQNTSHSGSTMQRKAIPGVSGYGNFVDLGNGKFGTTQMTDAAEVSGLVNEIRTKAAKAGVHQNIKVLTGTHGDKQGNLYGEKMFYTEDLAHEGHKIAKGGWINVLQVRGKTKETIEGWKEPGTSAVILAWCYSKTSDENWENIQADWKNFS